MPEHMYNLTVEALERVNKDIADAKVAILGWAFLNDSDDARNTPAEPYRDLLIDAGADVRVHDPHVLQYPDVEISQDLDAVLDGVDAAVIFAGHRQYYSLEPQQLQELSGQAHPVIVDGRNVVEPDAFIDAGFVYKGIGRGDKNGHEVN
jgi:UDP-N-acetyl-D-mannosaminuronic acid dehydrogenase